MVKRAIALAVALAFWGIAALAAPTLIFDDLSNGAGIDAILVDNSLVAPIDPFPTAGLLNYTGLAGGWSVSASAVTSSPTSGLPNFVESLLVTGKVGQLLVGFVDSFTGLPVGANPFSTTNQLLMEASGSTKGSSVALSLEQGTAGAAPALGANLTPAPYFFTTIPGSAMTFTNPSPGSAHGFGSSTMLVNPAFSPYSLAAIALITHTAISQTTSLTFTVSTVPEPGFYGLLALALAGLYFVGFRKRNRAAV